VPLHKRTIFSFSLALANAFGSAENMVPTSLDSRGLKFFLFTPLLTVEVSIFFCSKCVCCALVDFILFICCCSPCIPLLFIYLNFVPLTQRRCYSCMIQPIQHSQIWRDLEQRYCMVLMQRQWKTTIT